MGTTNTNDPKFKIGQTDNGDDVFIDPNSPVVQRLMQQQGAGNFWNAAAPAFQTGVSLVQADTLNMLKKSVARNENKLGKAQDYLKTTLIPAVSSGSPADIQAALSQVNGMFSVQSDIDEDQGQLIKIERDMALLSAGVGVLQLAGQFSGQNVVGYVPGPGGNMLPVLASGVIGGVIGAELEADNSRSRSYDSDFDGDVTTLG